jgi:hypothetical protein
VKDKEYKEGNNNNLTVLGIPRGGVIVTGKLPVAPRG